MQITSNGIVFNVKFEQDKFQSVRVRIFKDKEKTPTIGTVFSLTTTFADILEWAKARIMQLDTTPNLFS
jgi:hypothetical protein